MPLSFFSLNLYGGGTLHLKPDTMTTPHEEKTSHEMQDKAVLEGYGSPIPEFKSARRFNSTRFSIIRA